MAYAAGVDVGSTQTKAVVIDEARRIVGRALIETGANVVRAAAGRVPAGARRRRRARGGGRVRRRHRLRALQGDVRQHPGDRDQLPRPRRGAHVPRARARWSTWAARTPRPSASPPTGEIVDFCMNDKCAAGTGRFLGAASAALRHPARRAGRHRPARRAAGQDQHHLHGVRRVRGAVLAGQGQEDRGHPARRAPVDRRALGRPAAPRRHRGARSPSPAAWRATSAMVAALNERARRSRSTSARSRTTWARWARRCSRWTTSLAGRARRPRAERGAA